MDTLGPLDAWDLWGTEPPKPRDDLPIPGSPERCIRRRVVQGADGRLWLAERIAPAQADRRRAVAGLLEALGRAGLERICPYVRSRDDRFVVADGHGCRQVSPFVPGEELPRPEYVFDPRAGQELAGFLVELRAAWESVRSGQALGGGPARGPGGGQEEKMDDGSGDQPDFGANGALVDRRDDPLDLGLDHFSLADYVRDILDRMGRDPGGLGGQVHARAAAAAGRIAEFLEAEPAMPRTLAHGDLHPLNCIWQSGRDRRIAAVIDWEFAGPRHELYDLANAIGCMGIEDPACLGRPAPGSPLAAPGAMVAAMRQAGLLDDRTLPLLRPAIAASRFGWLSEWLRRGDRDMAGLELDYLDLLTGAP